MKKYICFAIVMFFYSVVFSQKTVQKDTTGRYDYRWKKPIENQDQEERRKAEYDPIIKRIYDTLGSDYLEQHFYHNGNLYYQVPFKNGKENGIYEKYYPNGQLHYKTERRDGHSNECNFISFDRFGDTSVNVICLLYHKKLYSFQTGYFYGRPSYLMVRDPNEILVAEFEWLEDKEKWVKHDYHVRSVKYANRLLRLYKKKVYQK